MVKGLIKSKLVIVVVFACGIVDFVLGFLKFRSVAGSIGAAFAGLPLSAIIVFIWFRTHGSDLDQIEDSHRQH